MTKTLRVLFPLCLILWAATVSATVQTDAPAEPASATLILVNPTDPYHPLADEIARAEGLELSYSLDDALAREPRFLLWVVSPERLSDDALVAFGRAMGDRQAALSTGTITGSTLEHARALWQRADRAGGTHFVAANAANPAARIEAGITQVGDTGTERLPLTRSNLLDTLQSANYLTFTFFAPLSPVSTFLLAGAGAFLFLNARSWRGRLIAVLVAALPAWAPALFLISILGVLDNVFMQAQLGADLWNHRPGLQPLLTAIFLSLLFWGASHVVARHVDRRPREVAKV